MFRDKYNDDFVRVPSISGEKVVDRYVLDEDSGKLVNAGKENIYESIQSFKDSTDINIILKQMEVGDDSRLHARQGVYMDVSNVPRNASELHKASIVARSQFNALPEELRNQFGSFDEFIDSDSYTIQSVLDNYNAKLQISNNDNIVDDGEKEI